MFSQCSKCKQKVYMPFECRCGKLLCAKHRYINKHKCQYDWQQCQKKKLELELPKPDDTRLTKIEDV